MISGGDLIGNLLNFDHRLQTGTILAHEMMHAWLRLKGTTISEKEFSTVTLALNLKLRSLSGIPYALGTAVKHLKESIF